MRMLRVWLMGALVLPLGGLWAETALLESAKEAYQLERYDRVIELLQVLPEAEEEAEKARHILASAHQRRGERNFQNGKIEDSLRDFDRVVELIPEQEPHHWQRGITQYYAERFAEGVKQFEQHRTVNPDDVENAVWHFLCAVRVPGGSMETARKGLIPVDGDGRVPMKEIHDLFGGKTTPGAVLEAGNRDGEKGRFYAELYVALYFEAEGKTHESLDLMARAATNPTARHYMGDVARTHLLVREGKDPAKQ